MRFSLVFILYFKKPWDILVVGLFLNIYFVIFLENKIMLFGKIVNKKSKIIVFV